MVDITEILTHWYAGRSKNEIAESLGVARNTVRKYLAPAEAAGIVPGGPPLSAEQWSVRVREWFPELADVRLRQVTWPTIEQHRDYIVAQLKAGVTVSTVHQRLRDEHELAVSIASMRRYVAANLPEEVRAAQVRVLRLREAEPGEQAQIDYGRLGRWMDPATGRRHTVQAFAMVLPASRHMFIYPVIKMDQQAWSAAHVAAFTFFGGTPARLVPDNLKTGVDRPDLYDPKINRAYAELAAHYGCLIDPARARKPRDKASVERPMPYIRDSFWRGRTFISVEQMREQALRWCTEVAGARHCRPLGGSAPLVVFEAIEHSRLQSLPKTPFVLAGWSVAKVGPDIHARVGKVLYSIPWRYLGCRLDVRSTAAMVQFFHDGQLIKTHPRKSIGKQTDLTDYPPEKIAFHLRTPAWCRSKAEQIGPGCVQVIAALLAENALYRLRAAQGVLGLGDKHDPGRLEAACAKALAVGDPSYKTIKGILIAGTDTEPAPPGHPPTGAGAFLHGPARLFALDGGRSDTGDASGQAAS
ncbi:IS21 family transposase [Sphaerisporangium sp. NPDC051017]|uniref:IS21 family transposase n=1 Tax=Sphaerisporangium sp. NPDC051017 TaxID=3154636 RepID=UPI0034332D1C